MLHLYMRYLGDNPPHDVWNETYNSQLGATQFLVDYLAQKLNRIIYPAMCNHGNHTKHADSVPFY